MKVTYLTVFLVKHNCLHKVVATKWCQFPMGLEKACKVQFRTIITYFVLYINDLSDNISCRIKLFADNIKVYSTIKDISDTVLLQKNLDMVNVWSLKI